MKISSLELHYHLRDGEHAMNAFVRNKCEAEALAAFVHVAQRLGINLVIETSAFTEGGLKEIWKFTTSPKHAYGNLMLLLAVIIPNFVAVWNAPPKDKELDGVNKEIAKLTLEEKQIAIEKARLELQKLANGESQSKTVTPASPASAASSPRPAKELTMGYMTLSPATYTSALSAIRPPISAPAISDQVIAILAEETKFTTRRSNFFKTLRPYEKVTAVGWRVHDSSEPSAEAVVEKKDFDKFILLTDKLPTRVIEEAMVHIAAPVITDSGMYWKGFYAGEPISFAMRDEAFKQMVMRREVSFQAGNAIRCRLEIEQKLDETGEPTITGYSVPVVIEKIDGAEVVETPQGKRQRFHDKHASAQQGFGFDDKAPLL